jgi:uncharacterized protein (DUF2147 family)
METNFMKKMAVPQYFRFALAMVLGASVLAAQAQMTPVGRWHSIDDKTHEVKSEIVITDNGGVLSGRVDKLRRKGADQAARCTECSDDRKDKPMLGLEIIRGAKKAEGKDVWEDGKILDPESGRNYSLRLTPIEGGAKLEVRGSIAFIGRTQTWVRVSAQP